MRTVPDSAEVIVSERGALIPVDMLDACGIQPGDRVAVLRTTRGSLLVVPVAPDGVGPSLGSVIGSSPRPVAAETDRAFLRDIRDGDDDRSLGTGPVGIPE